MTNNYFDVSNVKEKFAMLISKLAQSGLLLEYINDTIIKSPFFDCFEKNELDDFMNLSLETITEKVFRKEVVFDYSYEYVTPYYWAGLEVMDIMINYKVPLKRILLVMPLDEIIMSYNPFHEMNSIQFCKHYLEVEKSRNILKILRKEKGVSIRDLSYLVNIKESFLKVMDNSNATLMATSFRNLNLLSQFFAISLDVFRVESNYIPYSSSFIKGKTLSKIVAKNILLYFGVSSENNFTIITTYTLDKELRNTLKEYKYIVDLSMPYGLIYFVSHKLAKKYLSNEEFAFIYKKSIEDLKLTTDALIF